jgi:glycerophosphoryl diester phosphodiesterase
VASHRGDSRNHPENTLTAFQRAAQVGVAIQEFDVRQLRCGELVCVHDETFDRTSDACTLIGPGALVEQMDYQTAAKLDVGSWHQDGKCERVASLAEALNIMLPNSVPLIEHKSGAADRYVNFLRAQQLTDHVILQSFDWHFLAEVHERAPEIAIGALGPNPVFATLDAQVLTRVCTFGAELIHWQASKLTRASVAEAHAAGLFVCSYTTDDELGWLGGRAIGIDAMCTNDPATMVRALSS